LVDEQRIISEDPTEVRRQNTGEKRFGFNRPLKGDAKVEAFAFPFSRPK
jgi:hypothetical protein